MNPAEPVSLREVLYRNAGNKVTLLIQYYCQCSSGGIVAHT